jgi:putative peptidoglycan lipid II flippase
MSENRSLIKSTRVISLATLASRILGFFRDVVIARFFGTQTPAQAFVVAFRIPNLLRSIVGEGSANSVVVPVLSRLNEEGKREEFWQLAGFLLNILLVGLAVLTLLGELFAPYIVRAIAPGFIRDPAKLYLTIRLTRIMFPYLLLIGLAAYAMAVLNSLKHFALPALAPCMLNISIILSALIFYPRLKHPVDALGIGVLAGGILQLAIQAPLLFKKGLFKKGFSGFLRLSGACKDRAREIGRLFLPRTVGIAVYQLNLFVDTIFASLALIVGEGAPAALQYASRIVQFPLALFAVALSQVALPAMSGLAHRQNFDELKRIVSFSLRSVFTIMIPATVGLMVLARPAVKIIFERGTFSAYSTDITSGVLLFYCLGITGYAGIKILANCFYALKDTSTPGKIALVALLINVILNLILMRPLKMAGLALATAISVTVNFILLLFMLRRKIGHFEGIGPSLARIIFAAGIMSGALWFLFYGNGFLLGSRLLFGVKLGASIIAAVAVYLGALKLFAREEARIFTQWISRKR